MGIYFATHVYYLMAGHRAAPPDDLQLVGRKTTALKGFSPGRNPTNSRLFSLAGFSRPYLRHVRLLTASSTTLPIPFTGSRQFHRVSFELKAAGQPSPKDEWSMPVRFQWSSTIFTVMGVTTFTSFKLYHMLPNEPASPTLQHDRGNANPPPMMHIKWTFYHRAPKLLGDVGRSSARELYRPNTLSLIHAPITLVEPWASCSCQCLNQIP